MTSVSPAKRVVKKTTTEYTEYTENERDALLGITDHQYLVGEWRRVAEKSLTTRSLRSLDHEAVQPQ